VSEGRARPPKFLNLTFSIILFAKKVVFFVSSGENKILPLLAPPANIFVAQSPPNLPKVLCDFCQ